MAPAPAGRARSTPDDPTGPYNYFNPWWHPFYRRGDLHSMQSVTKTVTSVVIGVARTRKEFPDLDTPVLKFFDARWIKNLDDRKCRISIRHLLTMTAGQDWREDLPYEDAGNTTCAMEANFDWVQFALDRPMAAEPGTVFRYNSGATQLLAFIFHEATGRDMEEYAAEHLFRPLGIERYHWKRSPTGLVDAEGGLYLRPDDLAKIVYLFARDGTWDGDVLVDPAWVKASLAPSVTVVEGKVKYGFKWWLYAYGDDSKRWAWGGSGFGGQKSIVLPEYDLLMVFTGWNVRPTSPAWARRSRSTASSRRCWMARDRASGSRAAASVARHEVDCLQVASGDPTEARNGNTGFRDRRLPRRNLKGA